MHELIGRREIGLSPAGAKANELIAKHNQREGRLFSVVYGLRNISCDWSDI